MQHSPRLARLSIGQVESRSRTPPLRSRKGNSSATRVAIAPARTCCLLMSRQGVMNKPVLNIRPLLFALVFCLVLFALPLAITLVTSLRNSPAMGVVGDEWTFANYARLAQDGYFAGVLLTTVELGLVTATAATIVAYPLAYFIVRSSSRGAKALLALIIAPMFISSVVRAL